MTEYKVRIEYTVTGEVRVEVDSPEEIEAAVHDEMVFSPYCCLMDWDIGVPREVADG